MKPAIAGQLLRILGLAFEMFGLLGVVLVSRGEGVFPNVFGYAPDTLFKGMVAIGFVLLLIRRTMIAMNHSRRDRERDFEDQDPSGRGPNDLRL